MRSGQRLAHQCQALTSYSVSKPAATLWDGPLDPACAFPDPLKKSVKLGDARPVLALKSSFWMKGRGQLLPDVETASFPTWLGPKPHDE